MPCPLCGDECCCVPASRSAKSKFAIEPEVRPSILIDPEAYDASEQEFAASLEDPPPQPRFVVEPEQRTASASSALRVSENDASAVDVLPVPVPSLVLNAELPDNETRWRQEVAAKLNHYRARRSAKEPRFPSLQLKFETEPPRYVPPEPPAQPVLTQQAIPADSLQSTVQAGVRGSLAKLRVTEASENSGRILEFPRLAMTPPRRVDELADPILERPRILEVPDAPPAPPALGGILIGPVEKSEARPSEFEVPLQAASISRRAVATALDAVVVTSCVVVFADIFQSITPTALPAAQTLVASAGLFGVFWAGYHFLLLIYCGTTLGLRLTRMQLRRFDGKPVLRRTRRWRALSAVLSATSLGLGYAWCLLDEDQLCWHDRITRTYVSPQGE
jgi:uncharacterized RDD family membrane protein YckC